MRIRSRPFVPVLIVLPVCGAPAQETTDPAAPFSNHRPMWHPDGASMVFMSTRDGGENEWDLYTMHLDGTGLKRLTDHAGWDGYAMFSPDGRRLAFDRRDDTDGERVMIRNMESGVESLLYDASGHSAGGGRFSPDGARIVLTIERDDNREIYTIGLDGSNLRRLTDTPAKEADPCFAPDGASIVFATWMDGFTNIELMDADGRNRRLVRKVGGRAYGLDWSPDGARIVFNADDGEDDSELYIMNADGAGMKKLTDNDAWDHLPVFSPDGRHLLFTSYRSGVEEICMMDPDGATVVRIRTD